MVHRGQTWRKLHSSIKKVENWKIRGIYNAPIHGSLFDSTAVTETTESRLTETEAADRGRERVDQNCSVCFEPTQRFLPCFHPLCGQCISQLELPTCPVCRHDLTSDTCPELRSSPTRPGIRATYDIPWPDVGTPGGQANEEERSRIWDRFREFVPESWTSVQERVDDIEGRLDEDNDPPPYLASLGSSRRPEPATRYGPWFSGPVYDSRSGAPTFLETTRLGTDREGILIDPGAFDNIGGSHWFDRIQAILSKYGLTARTRQLERDKM